MKVVAAKARKLKARRDGLLAESIAAGWLRLKGYRILARNFKVPQGEIDIIAARGRVLAAIEVKRRSGREEALNAILPHQRRRIMTAIHAFLKRHPDYHSADIRFDAMAVTGWGIPLHLPDAWRE